MLPGPSFCGISAVFAHGGGGGTGMLPGPSFSGISAVFPTNGLKISSPERSPRGAATGGRYTGVHLGEGVLLRRERPFAGLQHGGGPPPPGVDPPWARVGVLPPLILAKGAPTYIAFFYELATTRNSPPPNDLKKQLEGNRRPELSGTE